jgi:hypothetical protein
MLFFCRGLRPWPDYGAARGSPTSRHTNSAALLIVLNCSRGGFAQLKLCAHFLDLHGLLFELRCEHLLFVAVAV